MELFKDAIQGMTEEMPPLAFPVGRAGRECVYVDLAKAPHMLLAGVTGSGKSVGLNVGISTIMIRARGRVRFHMVDPKRVELSGYANAEAVADVVTDMDDAADLIESLVSLMEDRYELLKEAGVKNIADYAALTGVHLPYEVLVVDELGDLMDTHSKQVLPHLIRLGQLARAAGIHMLLATQRPAADTIPKKLLANVPTRIAYQCQSHTESRLILGEKGAEELKGNGDLLAKLPGKPTPVRAQGPFISDEEIAGAISLSEPAEDPLADDEEVEEIDTEEGIAEHAGEPAAPAEEPTEAVNLVREALSAEFEEMAEELDAARAEAERHIWRADVAETEVERLEGRLSDLKRELAEQNGQAREYRIARDVAEATAKDLWADVRSTARELERVRDVGHSIISTSIVWVFLILILMGISLTVAAGWTYGVIAGGVGLVAIPIITGYKNKLKESHGETNRQYSGSRVNK